MDLFIPKYSANGRKIHLVPQRRRITLRTVYRTLQNIALNIAQRLRELRYYYRERNRLYVSSRWLNERVKEGHYDRHYH